jgi:hypothetical protein
MTIFPRRQWPLRVGSIWSRSAAPVHQPWADGRQEAEDAGVAKRSPASRFKGAADNSEGMTSNVTAQLDNSSRPLLITPWKLKRCVA